MKLISHFLTDIKRDENIKPYIIVIIMLSLTLLNAPSLALNQQLSQI